MAEEFKPGRSSPNLACAVSEMGIIPALNDRERAREIRTVVTLTAAFTALMDRGHV